MGSKKEFFCTLCGKSKGLLWNKRVDGIHPSERPCKECRSRIVGEKIKGNIPWNKGIPMPDDTKEKLRQAAMGQIAWNKGIPMNEESKIKVACSVRGIAIEEFDGFKNKDERQKYKEMQLSRTCMENANFTCAVCKKRGTKLNAHHMNGWLSHPEDRYAIDNLVCLCHRCHRAYHTQYGNGIKEPNTKEQFQQFLIKAKNNEQE